jgi:hypothetical protein
VTSPLHGFWERYYHESQARLSARRAGQPPARKCKSEDCDETLPPWTRHRFCQACADERRREAVRRYRAEHSEAA